jgi:PII-like signaling protein
MSLSGSARRLMIIIDEDRTWHHKPLAAEIVKRAHVAGLAGASAFRGIEGFGASSRVHTSRILSLMGKLPVTIIVVDTADKIAAFLPQLDELNICGLATLEDVEVVRVGQPAPS